MVQLETDWAIGSVNGLEQLTCHLEGHEYLRQLLDGDPQFACLSC